MNYFTTARGAIAIRTEAQQPRKLRRAIRATAFVVAFILGAFFMAPKAHAGPITYDPQLAADRLMLVQLIQRTSLCMNVAAKAGLHEGMKLREHLESFAASACGPAIRSFLITRVGMSARDAEGSVNALAADAVADVLIWGR